MTRRRKILLSIIVLGLGTALIWKLSQKLPSPSATTKSLPSYVPDETAMEVVELWPARRAGKWGYINRTGTFVIPPQFDHAREFSEGVALVQDGPERKFGFINKAGEMVIQPSFPQHGISSGFHEGLAKVSSKSIRLLRVNWVEPKYGFIDRSGKTVIQMRYDFAGDFHDGLARVGRKQFLNRKLQWGYINRHGELVIAFEFRNAWDFSEGLAAVQKDEGYYFIDSTGRDVFGKRFDAVREFAEGLAAVQVGKRWGFLNKAGEMVIAPQFRSTKPYAEGLAAVQTLEGLFGFIDRTGKLVIPAKYEDADVFSEGLAGIKLNDRWGVISKTGKVICEPQFPGLYMVARYRNGLARVSLSNEGWGSRLGYLDAAGKIVWREEEK